MDASWRIGLSMVAAAVLTPLAGRALTRAFPPRESNALHFDSLQAQYGSLELWSQAAAMAGGIVALVVFIASHHNTPWGIGLLFGWLVLAPVLLIAFRTLPRGLDSWRDFWRFYELRYGISMRLLGPLYAALCVLGL